MLAGFQHFSVFEKFAGGNTTVRRQAQSTDRQISELRVRGEHPSVIRETAHLFRANEWAVEFWLKRSVALDDLCRRGFSDSSISKGMTVLQPLSADSFRLMTTGLSSQNDKMHGTELPPKTSDWTNLVEFLSSDAHKFDLQPFENFNNHQSIPSLSVYLC